MTWAALTSLALIGSFVWPTSTTDWLRWICVAALTGLLLFAIALKFLPQRWRDWLAARPWAGWVGWFDWRRGVVLWLLRLVMFLLMLVYAGIGLAICHVPVSPARVVGIIPFVLLAESLPGTGGLGERETALVYLYPAPDSQAAVLLSFGLIWSVIVILGRVAIGVTSLYLPHHWLRCPANAARLASANSQSAASTNP